MNDTKNMTSHILSGLPAVILPRKGWSEGGCSSWRWRQRHKDDRTAQLACTKSKRLVRKWNRNGKMSRSRILWGVCGTVYMCLYHTVYTCISAAWHHTFRVFRLAVFAIQCSCSVSRSWMYARNHDTALIKWLTNNLKSRNYNRSTGMVFNHWLLTGYGPVLLKRTLLLFE